MRLRGAAGRGGEGRLRVETGELQQVEYGNNLCGRSPARGERGLAIVPAHSVRGFSAGV